MCNKACTKTGTLLLRTPRYKLQSVNLVVDGLQGSEPLEVTDKLGLPLHLCISLGRRTTAYT